MMDDHREGQSKSEVSVDVGLGAGETRTILWCVPRSVSTALTKCLSFVEGMEVWFEPFCYCHLAKMETLNRLGVGLPSDYLGNEELFRQAADYMNEVTNCHRFKPQCLPYGSVKEMLTRSTARHILLKDGALGVSEKELRYLPAGFKHTFIIRHPLRSFNSQRKMMFSHLSKLGLLKGEAADERTYDVERHNHYMTPGLFIKDAYDLWKYVRDSGLEPNPIVIDGDDLLANPAKMLPKFCQAVGLPYAESLLRWDASLDSVQRWKAPADDMLECITTWYGRATRSSEFMPATEMPKREELTDDVIRCADQVMPFYEEMYQHRMKP